MHLYDYMQYVKGKISTEHRFHVFLYTFYQIEIKISGILYQIILIEIDVIVE